MICVSLRLDSEICNFADVNTIYSCGLDLHEIFTSLKSDLSRLLGWLINMRVAANLKKFPPLFLGLKDERRLPLNIIESKLSATDHVKLLGIEADNK